MHDFPPYPKPARRAPGALLASGFVVAIGLALPAVAQAASCLYVSSYHAGYEWNDGIERGLAAGLQGKCELSRFYLDTNRNTDAGFARRKALEAKRLIEATRPDVVIACDDAASKYLVQPHFRNAPVPFVFCGVNWTVEPYGYPYANVTGIIEVAPIRQLMNEVRALLPTVGTGTYLAADVMTQHKEAEENRTIYAQGGIAVSPVFVRTMAQWQAAFAATQNASHPSDFVVLGTNAGIADWDTAAAQRSVRAATHKLVVSNYDWMAPFAVLTLAKIPEEQGEWAAQAAVSILAGAKPDTLPIVVNRRWQAYVNPELARKAGVQLPPRLVHKAIQAGQR